MNKKLRIALFGIAALVTLGVARLVDPDLFAWFDAPPPGPAPVVSANCDTAYNKGYCTKNQKKCTVHVVLSQCGVNVTPNVVPPELAVCEKNTKITWILDASGAASGAKFAYNGIDFKDHAEYHPRHDPKDEFQVKSRADTSYEVMDKKSNEDPANPDRYWYGIHILQQDASDCSHQDPMVSNE